MRFYVFHASKRRYTVKRRLTSFLQWQLTSASARFQNCELLFDITRFLAHLSRRLKGELIVYPCSGVRRHRRCCRCCQPFSNMNISEASRQIAIKFYLKHHWGGGKAAWGFGGDQFRTLVSMATDSSHKVTMGKTTSSHFLESF